MKLLATITVLIAAGLAIAGHAAAQPGPSEIVESAAQSMLDGLEANRDAYRKDPSKVGELVEKYLLPHFDIPYAARLVLGMHWRDATPEQRQRFADAFYHTLVNTYGSALVDFTSDRLNVFPTNVEAETDRATVRTEVTRDNGEKVAVNYSLRKTDAGWKAWDVVIEGISYVRSFREDYGAAIDKQGLDAVIERLERSANSAPSTEGGDR